VRGLANELDERNEANCLRSRGRWVTMSGPRRQRRYSNERRRRRRRRRGRRRPAIVVIL